MTDTDTTAIEVQAEPVETTLEERIASDLATFTPTEAAIAELGTKYVGLTITDKDSEKEVRAACRDVVAHRTAIEKRRKELKADALTYGRAVDAEAKRLKELLLPIEELLAREIDRVNEERRAEQEAKARALKERAETRCAALAELGAHVSTTAVTGWSDEEYEAALEEARELKAATDAKRAAEAEERAKAEAAAKAEAERLAAERAKLDAERAELEAERKRIADEKAAAERAEQERRDAEERAEREKQEAEERAKREAAEAKRREESRPLADCIRREAEAIEERVDLLGDAEPVVRVRRIMSGAALKIREIADSLDGGAA